MSLIAELKRRNVIRMAGLYLVGAWLIAQVAETILPAFDVPNWVMRAIVIVLALGVLPALAFAWVFELTPQGLKRDGEVRPEESIAPKTAQRMNRMIMLLLALAVLYFGFDKFVLDPQRDAAMVAAVEQRTEPPVSTMPDAKADDASIAVLPFVDMSQGKDQEYFSDGLSEQLLNGLAQLPGLHVAGRTSSFYFKGRNEDLRVIGEKLNVATVLEGSVAKSGDTLRVTAQLINATDGYHLWSHTYDLEFKDVFALQDEITAHVVAALKLKLLPGRGAVAGHSDNPEAYDSYLLGLAGARQDSPEGWTRAEAAFARAIELDPGDAASYAELGLATYEVAYSRDNVEQLLADQKQALQYAQTAIRLDSDLAAGYRVRARIRAEALFDVAGAMTDIQRALELSPGSSSIQTQAGVQLAALGRFEEARSALEKAVDIDPLYMLAVNNLAVLHMGLGHWSQAFALYERARQLAPGSDLAQSGQVQSYLLGGNIAQALAAAQRMKDGPRKQFCLALVRHSQGKALESDQALDNLIREYSAGWAYQVGAAYAWRGQPDRAFEWLDRAYAQHDGGLLLTKVDPLLASLRDDPRYDVLLKQVGLLP